MSQKLITLQYDRKPQLKEQNRKFITPQYDQKPQLRGQKFPTITSRQIQKNYNQQTKSKEINLKPLPRNFQPRQTIEYTPSIEGELIPLNKTPPPQPQSVEQPTQVIQTPQPITVFQPFPIFQPPFFSKEQNVSPVYGLDLVSSERYKTHYAPSLSEKIKNRLKYLFEPIVSNVSYREIGHKYIFSPTQGYKQRRSYRPINYKEFITDHDYEPVLIEKKFQDFSPQEITQMSYAPQIAEESYPIYNYSVFGLPDTYVHEHAPIFRLKLKPVTDFEIKLRPKVISFNHSYQTLLINLLKKVV